MKNSEEAIEKVLAGLRDAEAPVGMERRILSALEERESVRTRSGWRWLRPVWLVAPLRPVVTRPVVCGVALASVFVAALAIPAIRRLAHGPAESKTNQARARGSAGAVRLATSEMAASGAQLSPTRSSGRSTRKTNESGVTSATTATVVRPSDRDGHLDSDSTALNEMYAASHPAPPMPLTEQERLLLRIAHRGDPVELAMLDPVLRDVRDAEEQADFQRFFGPERTEQPTAEPPKEGQPAEQPTTEPSTAEPSTVERLTTGENE